MQCSSGEQHTLLLTVPIDTYSQTIVDPDEGGPATTVQANDTDLISDGNRDDNKLRCTHDLRQHPWKKKLKHMLKSSSQPLPSLAAGFAALGTGVKEYWQS